MILDNLSTHRSPKAAEILHAHGCWFRSREKPSTERLSDPSNLPAYSPELRYSPILGQDLAVPKLFSGSPGRVA